MEEIHFKIPQWVIDKVLPILKTAGKAAAVAACAAYLPAGAIWCGPAIDALIH